MSTQEALRPSRSSGGYGGNGFSPPIVRTTLELVRPSDVVTHGPALDLRDAVLPVGLAVSPSGAELAVAAYGSDKVITIALNPAPAGCAPGDCFPSFAFGVDSGTRISDGGFGRPTDPGVSILIAEPIAVAYDSTGSLLIQTRQSLQYRGTTISLSSDAREHTGHRLFHRNAGRGVACAS